MRAIPPGEALGGRIRELRGSHSQKVFAQRLGVSVPTLKRYESGQRTPDVDLIRDLCQETGADPNWLLWGEAKASSNAGKGEVPILPYPGDPPMWLGVPDQFIHVPFLPQDTTGDAEDVSLLPHASIAFSTQWLRQKGLEGDHLLMVEAVGYGMAPTIPQGALLLVSTKEQGGPVDGTYMVRIGNRLLPRRVQPEWHGGVLLRSDNPACEDEHLTPEEAQALQVVGHVVWIGNPFL